MTSAAAYDKRLQNLGGKESFADLFYEAAADAITAFAGGGQANATQLAAQTNRVTVVATRGDSVKLQAATPGLEVTVINDGANPVAVFPATGDLINGQAANISVTQMQQSVDVYACGVAGKWHAEVGSGYLGSLVTDLSEDNIVAFAGGGQASARLLTSQINRIITVTTSGDSVRLPASGPGIVVTVINHGANPMQVYGLGTDTVNDVATATGVSQMQNSTCFYLCSAAGNWYTEGLASGFANGLPTSSSANGLTAFAGGGQGSGTLVSSVINRFTTVVSAGDSGKLPAAVAGLQIVVYNAAAVNSMNMFPNTGDSINALAANAAFAVASGKNVAFGCPANGIWHAILSA